MVLSTPIPTLLNPYFHEHALEIWGQNAWSSSRKQLIFQPVFLPFFIMQYRDSAHSDSTPHPSALLTTILVHFHEFEKSACLLGAKCHVYLPLLAFLARVLCTPSWPWTCCVAKDALELLLIRLWRAGVGG